MATFLSYARADATIIDALRDDMEYVRGTVWIDRRLWGGQDWWDEVLAQIRNCDLFVVAVSPASLSSDACLAELEYARAVGRSILPVVVAAVDLAAVPEEVSRRQVVHYIERTADTMRDLSAALARYPTAEPFAGELPDPPPMPASYSQQFRRKLAAPELTLDEQIELVSALKLHLEIDEHHADALEMLKTLRNRPDLTVFVAGQVKMLLDHETATSEPPEPTGTPDPSGDEHEGDNKRERESRRRWSLSWWPVPLVLVAGVLMVVVIVWLAVRPDSGGGSATTTAPPTSPRATTAPSAPSAAPVPGPPTVDHDIGTGTGPLVPVVVGEDLWVTTEGGLERYDLANQTTLPPIPLASTRDVILDGDRLWVTQFDDKSVRSVDTRTGQLDIPIKVPGQPLSGVMVGDTLWLTLHNPDDGGPGALVPIRNGAAGATIPVQYAPNGITVLDDRLWITSSDGGILQSVNPATGDPGEPITVGAGPVDVQAIDGMLWVTVSGEDKVVLVDPVSHQVTMEIPVGDQPWKLAEGFDAVWVTNRAEQHDHGTVSRIDRATLAQTDVLDVGFRPDEIAIGPNEVYVTNYGGKTITVIAPGG